jgi:hypothetical protein
MWGIKETGWGCGVKKKNEMYPAVHRCPSPQINGGPGEAGGRAERHREPVAEVCCVVLVEVIAREEEDRERAAENADRCLRFWLVSAIRHVGYPVRPCAWTRRSQIAAEGGSASACEPAISATRAGTHHDAILERFALPRHRDGLAHNTRHTTSPPHPSPRQPPPTRVRSSSRRPVGTSTPTDNVPTPRDLRICLPAPTGQTSP